MRHAWVFESLPCLAHLSNPVGSGSDTKPLLRVGAAKLVFSKGIPMGLSLTVHSSVVIQYCASAQKKSHGDFSGRAQVELDLVFVTAGTHLQPVNERFQFFGQVRVESQHAILILVLEVNSILERIRILKRYVIKKSKYPSCWNRVQEL